MNAAVLILFGVAWFLFAYFWYAKIIQEKVLKINDANATPSHTLTDGKDYVPTKKSILFGHHFASIAGAGPIVGPILGFAYFGWLPAMLWILIGAVFMGGVHDFAALVASLRNKGVSIVEFANDAVSPKASYIFAVFVWLTLMLVQAVFADLTARTFAEDPHIVAPTLGLILLALLFGYIVYRKNFNLTAGTVIGILALIAFIFMGESIPIKASYDFWLVVIIAYSFIAAILPVWILLQPRDYLSMYLLIIGLVLGVVGVVVLSPDMNAPAFIGFDSAKGPLFPVLFITIACGAISGFHSLVSSGTSSKQLDKERDAKFVSYGSMLTEGLLALMVLTMISSVLVWGGDANAANSFQSLLKKSANLVFGGAFGRTVQVFGIPLKAGISLGVLIINAFLLTTLDTSARLNRYILQETLGKRYGGAFANKYFAAAASLVVAYFVALGGYRTIWPVFGASNQLIATLSLFVVTVYFLGFKAPKWYTLAPAIFMLIVTETSLIYSFFWDFVPNKKWHLAIIAAILAALGVIVAWESYKKIRELTKRSSAATENG